MARRVSLPAADDLFRPTHADDDVADEPAAVRGRAVHAVPDAVRTPGASSSDAEEAEPARKAASGRVRHDEKMTVYVTAAELMDLERARLALRGDHGLAVDRGRLVREAVALVLHEFEEHGADSLLVRRLTDPT